MDSDTDQDEDEIKSSFSVEISERGSHSRVVGKVCSDSRKSLGGVSSSSGSIEEPAVEENVIFVKDSTSEVSLSDTSSVTNNEESSLRVIRVSCYRPQKRLSCKSVVDDRICCAEKAVDDVCDSVHDLKETGDDNKEVPANLQDSSEQSIIQNVLDIDSQNREEESLLSSTVPAPVDSGSQDMNLERPEESKLLKESVVESISNDKSSDYAPHLSTNVDNGPLQNINSRDVQNKKSEMSVDCHETVEMIAKSPIFQGTSVPVGCVEAGGTSRLLEGITLKESGQDSSSTGQLAGRKRKHSGKKTADAEGAVGGSSAENSVSSGDAEESFENKDSDKEAKKKKNRCAVCRKKVGLTGFECRCGGLFCAVHRYSDKHDCTFDYREMGAQEIRRNNPVVVGEKIQKI